MNFASFLHIAYTAIFTSLYVCNFATLPLLLIAKIIKIFAKQREKFRSRFIRFFHRFFIAYGNTDEIFGICSCREGKLDPFYCYGAISVASPGWAFGTFLGVLSGSILPARILSALGVALYGMFIAVIIPPAKTDKIIRGIVLVSMAVSFVFTIIPVLNQISSGFRIILLTLLIAGTAALLFPIKSEEAIENT